ncbi:S41 family peptidase [Sphingomonas sp. DT-51]|uniref:S41 family peptidase n=1 Tax=Sphingomonas sp. DT-51 TaxID=3396165 RepID=UPI003F1DF323
MRTSLRTAYAFPACRLSCVPAYWHRRRTGCCADFYAERIAVSYLVSYFLPAGKRIEISGIVERKAGTTVLRRKSFFSEPTPVSFAGVPAYVLTSGNTFSGGEELAYDIQALKLGTVVGEVTGGGANPGVQVPIGHGVTAFISTGRAENPLTGSKGGGAG